MCAHEILHVRRRGIPPSHYRVMSCGWTFYNAWINHRNNRTLDAAGRLEGEVYLIPNNGSLYRAHKRALCDFRFLLLIAHLHLQHPSFPSRAAPEAQKRDAAFVLFLVFNEKRIWCQPGIMAILCTLTQYISIRENANFGRLWCRIAPARFESVYLPLKLQNSRVFFNQSCYQFSLKNYYD